MTLRSSSRGVQWARWLFAAALALCAYVVVFRVLYEGSLGDVFGAMQLRVLLPVLTAFGVFAYETRWDGVEREKEEVVVNSGSGRKEGEVVVNSGSGRKEELFHSTTTTNNYNSSPTPTTNSNSPAPGEAEYAEARVMKHRPIPDCKHDGKYLKLLAKSAQLGYPRAMMKLGEYAMRRCAWVEAYYWFSQAKKSGMKNLDRLMQRVRFAWAQGGFRRERANEYSYFSHEQGTTGYTLLCIDARHNADAAKARLAECAPEFYVKKH